MKVLLTGANGFMGKNIDVQLSNCKGFDVLRCSRDTRESDLRDYISQADFICHMAGVNRPDDVGEFAHVNTGFTKKLCELAQESGRHLPILFSSSMHVERNNPYGDSKLAAEQLLLKYSELTGSPVYIFRLPHVIGKWCRPNYNSVVATFCHNIARDQPIQIDDPNFPLRLVHIDDFINRIVQIMTDGKACGPYCEVKPEYPISVGELADQLHAFRNSRKSLASERVGTGLTRILYATYMSYLPKETFSYEVPAYKDSRGVFVEMLKTRDSGQFSFFTAHPGITRGSHYHHAKSEKFLVIKGEARFRFRHILTQEKHEIVTSGDKPQIVETIPGWTHDITNIGEQEMIVMLWANEIFNRDHPDTYSCPV